MLLDIPKMIIKKYIGLSKDSILFPVPSNTTCNDSLKRVSKIIGCHKEKKVNFHLEGHTFATLFLSKGVPLESLTKMLDMRILPPHRFMQKLSMRKSVRICKWCHPSLKVWNGHLHLNINYLMKISKKLKNQYIYTTYNFYE